MDLREPKSIIHMERMDTGTINQSYLERVNLKLAKMVRGNKEMGKITKTLMALKRTRASK